MSLHTVDLYTYGVKNFHDVSYTHATTASNSCSTELDIEAVFM